MTVDSRIKFLKIRFFVQFCQLMYNEGVFPIYKFLMID